MFGLGLLRLRGKKPRLSMEKRVSVVVCSLQPDVCLGIFCILTLKKFFHFSQIFKKKFGISPYGPEGQKLIEGEPLPTAESLNEVKWLQKQEGSNL